MTNSVNLPDEKPAQPSDAERAFDDFMWELGRDISKAAESFGLDKKKVESVELGKLSSKLPYMYSEVYFSIENNISHLSPRIGSHIERLLNPERTVQENYFGLLFTYYGLKDGRNIYPDVARVESRNTGFFWSFGPYLAEQLSQYGLPPSDIIQTIFSWGEKADHEVPLPGTEKFMDNASFTNFGMILSLNPEDHTHQFAKGISQLMCEQTEPFKSAIEKRNPARVRDVTRPLKFRD